MDVLSEVLRVIRLSGAIHFCAEFTAPWSFSTSPPALAAARLKVPGGSVTPFHICVYGNCIVTLGDREPLRIDSGDVVVFPRGDQHVMASEAGLTPVAIKDIYEPSKDHIGEVKYGGGGTPSRFICGYLQSDNQFDPLLKSLPAILCVRSRNSIIVLDTQDAAGDRSYPIDQKQEIEWWRATVQYLMNETAVPGPGNRAILARLAETLFVEVIRWQLRLAGQGLGGWLAGLHDPQIGHVLRLLHAQPERSWTVDDLANEAAISRAVLAKRFVELVGQSPIQYLTDWRMHLARDLLRNSNLGVSEIAGRVGYESETAFNRAFRRCVGKPPARWRCAMET